MKTIGITGISGRMGQLIYAAFLNHKHYKIEGGFDIKSPSQGHVFSSIAEVLQKNDCVIDFSSRDLTSLLLNTAACYPKPMIIGTTAIQDLDDAIKKLAKQVPIVIAPNTSLGACLQRNLVCKLADILPDNYEIDILDEHHRDKIDAPSGTAKAIADAIIKVKKEKHNVNYSWGLPSSPRKPYFIGVSSYRKGHVPGYHKVTFTSDDEEISVTHTAFNRDIFAKGVIKIVDWLSLGVPPGLYTMDDVFGV